jgi:predicted nucleic acid-binding protein
MWEEAGLLAYKLHRKGKSIGLANCYIAIVAAKTDSLVYSYDKYFEELAPLCNLELYGEM